MNNKITEVMKLEFSLDYVGECESVDNFTFRGVDCTDDVKFQKKDVDEFVKELKKIDGFDLSYDRTEVEVTWYSNSTMTIWYRKYNGPDWSYFEDKTIKDVPIIPF